MSTSSPRTELTQFIAERLKDDIQPSRLLWSPSASSRPVPVPKRHNGEPYRGWNRLNLSIQTIRQGFESPFWFTEKQAEQLGAETRDGATGVRIVFCGSTEKLVKGPDGSKEMKTVFFERSYVVYNADQCRGLPLKYHGAFQDWTTAKWGPSELDQYFRRIRARIVFGGNQAAYVPKLDLIRMPEQKYFIDTESYYSVLCHEHVHSTGHQSRLDRNLGEASFGDSAYGFEELIAEFGAAFFCSQIGITPAVREDHISYIGSWLQVVENDQWAIYSAANRASDALDYLNSFQPTLQLVS